jgi:hypothetical protein
VSKAQLFHLAVVACLIAFALISALAFVPDGMWDGPE